MSLGRVADGQPLGFPLDVVPLLVGGDGYALVPDVVPVIPWPAVGLVAAVSVAALVAGTFVAARQVTSELFASLREGTK